MASYTSGLKPRFYPINEPLPTIPSRKKRKNPSQTFEWDKSRKQIVFSSQKRNISPCDLPARLFGKITAFLGDADLESLIITSHNASTRTWNARILQKWPKAYSFYREAISEVPHLSKGFLIPPIPCRQHYTALCQAEEVIHKRPATVTFCFQKLNHCISWFGYAGTHEPFERLLIREAFISLSSFPVKISRFSKDLQGEFPILLETYIAFKQLHGRYASGEIGGKRFYVIGEQHTDPTDIAFTFMLNKACENQIVFFREGIFACEEDERLKKMQYGISSTAQLYGIEAVNPIPKYLSLWGFLLDENTANKPKIMVFLIEELLLHPQGVNYLLKALLAVNANRPHDHLLINWITNGIDWINHRWKPGFEFKEEMQKKYPDCFEEFIYTLGKVLAERDDLLTTEENSALKKYLTFPSQACAVELIELFIKKRDLIFVDNIRKRLPLVDRPFVVLVGHAHQTRVFNELLKLSHP